MKAYSINIVGLGNKVHQFDYQIGSDFFKLYGTGLVSEGSFTADVTLDKHETFIEAGFTIKGTASLTCDRSLDVFDYPVETTHRMLFKFGEEDQEVSDEISIIHRDTVTLELGHYIYEFIALAIPMKKLHPRFQNDSGDDEGKIIYSSGADIEDEKTTDPRWDKLKNLK